MNSPELHRLLRIAWSVGWGVVAVLLCVLWIRSYWRQDILTMPVTNRIVTTSVSFQGSLYSSVTYSDTADTLGIQFVKFELLSLSENAAPMEESWSAGWQSDPTPAAFALCPHWFAASIVTLIAALPWLHFRFSLRTLLIATTLIAVVLGIIVWVSRAG